MLALKVVEKNPTKAIFRIGSPFLNFTIVAIHFEWKKTIWLDGIAVHKRASYYSHTGICNYLRSILLLMVANMHVWENSSEQKKTLGKVINSVTIYYLTFT